MASFTVTQQFIRRWQGLRGLPLLPNCLGKGFSSSQEECGWSPQSLTRQLPPRFCSLWKGVRDQGTEQPMTQLLWSVSCPIPGWPQP